MSLKLRLRRWRALRGVPELTASSPDGAVVRATGIARATADDDVIVPPLAGVPCVVAWTKFFAGATNSLTNPLVLIERLVIKPFVLEASRLRVLVDASHVELLFPIVENGRMHEISIAVGATVTVIGNVLRDGIERPTDELVFRDAQSTYKLVGNKAHPVVITASVSDTHAR